MRFRKRARPALSRRACIATSRDRRAQPAVELRNAALAQFLGVNPAFVGQVCVHLDLAIRFLCVCVRSLRIYLAY